MCCDVGEVDKRNRYVESNIQRRAKDYNAATSTAEATG